MPGNHGEISIDEYNGVDNDNKKKKTMTTRKKKKKKKKDVVIADDFENGNDELVMPSISKTKKKRFIAKIISNKPKSPVRCSSHHSPSPHPPSSRSGSRKGGCFCVIRPRRNEEEDSPSSPTSDPNDECFTHEMLRVMLETNDFYSNDCNPHR